VAKSLITRFLKFFNATELLTFAYIAITALYVLVFFNKMDSVGERFVVRLACVGVICFLAALSVRYPSRILDLIRYLFPVALIVYWYPETSYLNDCIFRDLDKVFAGMEEQIFGCQPSLLFCKIFPQSWVSELMSFGYSSFFVMIALIIIYFRWRVDCRTSEKISFVVLCSFFLYYIIFILLPVEGPQFYFPDNQIPPGYAFSKILNIIQFYGEERTGAFPSSHVGMTMIILIIFWRYRRPIFYALLPVAFVLVLSTVYLKAHYAIDVVGGFISAPIILFISLKLSDYFLNYKIQKIKS
jgi:membrane-associated phospholipid phosphatase